jgi:hypothetical protein
MLESIERSMTSNTADGLSDVDKGSKAKVNGPQIDPSLWACSKLVAVPLLTGSIVSRLLYDSSR